MTGRHAAAMFVSGLLVFGLVGVALFVALHVNPLQQDAIVGAVVVDDSDPRKQMPIPNVHIVSRVGSTVVTAESDANGAFRVKIPSVLALGRSVKLSFDRPGYQPRMTTVSFGAGLQIVRLRPIQRSKESSPQTAHSVANVRMRYTEQVESLLEVGAAVRTFLVANAANVPCRGALPCSPDGRWKAATGDVTLDAHEHNRFRNIRVSCIAGPCPFTRIESEDLRNGGQILRVSAINWSDTATFLVEADVVRSQLSDMIRQSFPVVFGEGLSFTLPPHAAGLSLEAEIDRQDTYFPLGPALLLSWAQCTETTNLDGSSLYSCELKSGYRFQ